MSPTRNGPRRGIYLLPNLFTTGALFAGFFAITAAIQGEFISAAIAVFVAGILDGLDGRVARMTGTQSDFGVQYDSLSDLISFGLAPAVLMYTWSLQGLGDYGPFWGKIGWSAAFLYAACAALRLARFNTQVGVADKRFFQGLASPAAAGTMAALVWSVEAWEFEGDQLVFLTPFWTVALALLMVSRVRYHSFKAWPVPERVPFLWILAVVVLFALLSWDLPRGLLVLGLLYVLSGPVMTLWGLRHRRRRREPRREPAMGALADSENAEVETVVAPDADSQTPDSDQPGETKQP